jgi:inosose dehydratase
MTFAARIGINPISWTNDDLPSLGGETPLETALAEGKAIGYEGFELGNKFPRDAEALRAVLARHGLACVSGWYSGHLARGTVADEIAAADAHLTLLAANEAKELLREISPSTTRVAVPRDPAVANGRRLDRLWRARHGIRTPYADARRAPRLSSPHGCLCRDRR